MPAGIYKKTEEHKRKISETLKGHLVSPETKRKQSEAKMGRKQTAETIEKRAKSNKGQKRSEETKRKIGLGNKGKKHPPHSEETRRKISIGNKGKKKLPFSEEHRKKMSDTQKGKKRTKETRRKIRISIIQYIEKVCGNIYPRIGRNEKQILDKLEQELNHKIIRQYKVCGYFIDGYIQEIKLAIEVDERPKIKEKDIEREKIIKEELGCEFLRIKDYD